MWIDSGAKVPEDAGKSRSFHQRSGSVIKKWHINDKPRETLPYEDIYVFKMNGLCSDKVLLRWKAQI